MENNRLNNLSIFHLSFVVTVDPAWFPWVEHVTADPTDLKPAKEKGQNHYNMKYDSFSGHNVPRRDVFIYLTHIIQNGHSKCFT